MNKTGDDEKTSSLRHVGNLGALAAIAGIPSFASFQAEWAREESKRQTELRSLVELTGQSSEEILSAFHRFPGDWMSFSNFIMQTQLEKNGLTDGELKSFRLEQS